MPFFLNLLLRLVLLAAGLAIALVVASVFLLVGTSWALRAGWARLTGRPVTPFGMRMGPRGAFGEVWRRARQPASRTPRADATIVRGARLGDVTDVDPR